MPGENCWTRDMTPCSRKSACEVPTSWKKGAVPTVWEQKWGEKSRCSWPKLQEGNHDHWGRWFCSHETPPESCILLWGSPHGRGVDLLDAEARHKCELRAGAPLPWRQAERVGVIQPGEEEASSLPVPEWGLQKEGAFHKGEWLPTKRRQILGRNSLLWFYEPLLIEEGTPWWIHCTLGIG